MDDISEQLAIRDSFRKKMEMQRTPEDRMRAFRRLQEACEETMRRSPKGYAHFRRRNLKARAIDVRGLDVA
ncbi:MAG: hypothetical protein JWL69_1716 [Phycisphaerales bacterium]|nr:hypothetical protein [Phycisphaerales bacterium]